MKSKKEEIIKKLKKGEFNYMTVLGDEYGEQAFILIDYVKNKKYYLLMKNAYTKNEEVIDADELDDAQFSELMRIAQIRPSDVKKLLKKYGKNLSSLREKGKSK